MVWHRHLRTAVGGLGLAAALLTHGEVSAQPVPVVTCPTFPDTREGQIKRGVCAGQKLARLATNGQASSRETANRVCETEIPCIVGMCQVARNVCKGIVDPQCNHGGLELPADGPAFRNAACRAPRGGCQSGGTAEEQRICNEIRPHLPPEFVPDPPARTERQLVNPKFHVVSVLYAPPGTGSEVLYGDGSTLGARTDWSTSAGHGIAMNAMTSLVDVSSSYTYSSGSGGGFEVRKGRMTTLGAASQSDGVDHDKDMFLVWLNPQLVIEKTWYPGGWTRFAAGAQNRDGSPFRVDLVPASQLKNPSTMPPERRARFAGFTAQDFDTILKTSPFAGGPWETDRFEKLETIQVSGPDVAGGTIPIVGLELTDENTKLRSRTSKHSAEVEVTVGFKASFILEAGIKVGGRWTFDAVTSDESSTTSAQRASLTLKSSTPGYNEAVDVYYDRIYRTFAFKGHGRLIANAPNMSGIVRDAAGRPAAGQVVTVKMPDGSIRRVGTDTKGQYRVYELPTGTATVMTAAESKSVVLGPKAGVDLRAAATTPKFAPIPKGAPSAPVPVGPAQLPPANLPRNIPRLGK